MPDWKRSAVIEKSTGRVSYGLEDDERKAMVSLTSLPGGEYVVSLTVCVRASEAEAKAFGAALVEQHRRSAVPL